MILFSSYPQVLEGVRNFHTAIVTNSPLNDFKPDETMEIEVKWDDNSEKIKLKKLENNMNWQDYIKVNNSV